MTWTCRNRSFRSIESARGVTLLELLIVLALLIAIAAAVGPTVLTQLDERRFESAMDVTARQMVLARAHAQSSGLPVEVLSHANAERTRVSARLLAIEMDDEPQPLAHHWAERMLAFGYTIADHPPQQGEAFGVVDEVQRDSSRVRLAVFLPDGSAMHAGRRWLSDGNGRVARIDVNPYTGEVTFTRLAPEDLRVPEDEEELMRWDAP